MCSTINNCGRAQSRILGALTLSLDPEVGEGRCRQEALMLSEHSSCLPISPHPVEERCQKVWASGTRILVPLQIGIILEKNSKRSNNQNVHVFMARILEMCSPFKFASLSLSVVRCWSASGGFSNHDFLTDQCHLLVEKSLKLLNEKENLVFLILFSSAISKDTLHHHHSKKGGHTPWVSSVK